MIATCRCKLGSYARTTRPKEPRPSKRSTSNRSAIRSGFARFIFTLARRVPMSDSSRLSCIATGAMGFAVDVVGLGLFKGVDSSKPPFSAPGPVWSDSRSNARLRSFSDLAELFRVAVGLDDRGPMTRRIVLVDLYWTRDKDPRVPLGHASLLAALAEQAVADVRSVITPINADFDPEALVDRVMAEVGDGRARDVDVAVGTYVWAEREIQRLLTRLRERGFTGRIILGGPQISYADRGVARLYPQADVFVRGYGEQAIRQLAMSPGKPRIPGVVLRGDLIDNVAQAAIDLEALPSPWLGGQLNIEEQRFIRWETQRGCPYRCSFCQHREAGESMARRSLADTRVLAEIDLFCRHGVEDIAILDPVFNSQRQERHPRAIQILERFAGHGFRGRLSIQCRPELIDDRFLDACAKLDTRLEFGLQTTQPREWRPIQRGNKLELVERTFAGCQARSINHEVSLIFGLPGQTLASFESSIQWCLERRVPVIKAFPLMLLRGTPLERDRERWQLRESADAMPVVVASSSFGEREWRSMARLSDALRASEGSHPATIEQLRRATVREIDTSRWSPDSVA
ncbi:B12-binding domain-containing radical SAM protein [Nannocystaceae bacterium ST9]